jgi:serpin B
MTSQQLQHRLDSSVLFHTELSDIEVTDLGNHMLALGCTTDQTSNISPSPDGFLQNETIDLLRSNDFLGRATDPSCAEDLKDFVGFLDVLDVDDPSIQQEGQSGDLSDHSVDTHQDAGSLLAKSPSASVLPNATSLFQDRTSGVKRAAPINHENPLVEAFRGFSFEIFNRLASQIEPGSNIIASPFSIATALAMTLNGAEGETYQGIAQTLQLQEVDVEALNAAAQALTAHVDSLDPEVRIKIVNSIWVNPAMTLRPEYQGLVERVYGGRVDRLTDAATINSWIAEQTDGKITDMIDSDRVDLLTAAFLINAITFQAKWVHQFPMGDTFDRPFTTDNSTQVSPQMMTRSQSPFQYMQGDGFEFIRLPYGNGRMSMVIALPGDVISASDLQMSAQDWTHLMVPLHRVEAVTGSLMLPKFRNEFDARPNAILRDMGMTLAYDQDRANFSGMVQSAPDNVYVSDVHHRAGIAVTEEGTEAQATTVVEMRFRGAGGSGGFRMHIDRPFFYSIQDDRTHLPIFMGWINDPTKVTA